MSSDPGAERKDLVRIETRDGRINFVCLREECPHSCCGPFGGVQRGIESIEGREFSEILLTPDDYRKLAAAGRLHLTEKVGNRYRMRLLEDGACSALKGGMCSIHDTKPTVCRAFPFYVDMFVGLCAVTTCPGFGAGWTPVADLVGEIEASKKMYQHWLDQISTDEKPSGGERELE